MAYNSDSDDTMRQSADWMVLSDDRILELMRDHGNLTPKAVDDLGGPGHARNRLPLLAEAGLVEKISHGLYQITDEGVAYLDEDLDASELPSPEESD